jgi:DNA modification methylase
VDRRDTSGSHEAWYWGNFIPKIPQQMILRYTQQGDWVLDPFVGSGTTLLECRRLGRHGLGVELNPDVAARASATMAKATNPYRVTTEIVVGDSQTVDYADLLAAHNVEQVQLLILHPPYHDIIQFSEAAADLSNRTTVEAFVKDFTDVVRRSSEVLETGRYMAVVIGDKYQAGTWIPLGFRLMDAVLDLGFTLKSVVVKNVEGTRAKRNQRALWRYRALAGGFYVFKHEYIFIFES